MERKNEEEEKRKLDEMDEKTREIYNNIKERDDKKKKKRQDFDDLPEDDLVRMKSKELIKKMEDAMIKDNKARENKKPAFAKLMLMKELTSELRKFRVQEQFMIDNGLGMFAKWLDGYTESPNFIN